MADVLNGIDHILDGWDRMVDKIVGTSAAEPAKASAAAPRRRGRFSVEGIIDAQTGRQTWIVSDGVDKAECTSETFARRLEVLLGR